MLCAHGVFFFRTDKDGTDGADTDSQGRIYVEGVPVPAPANLEISFEDASGTTLASASMYVGPVMTNLDLYSVEHPPYPEAWTAKLKEFQGHDAAKLDPYEDEFDLHNCAEVWPWSPPQQKCKWYGMQINYRLLGTVTNLRFRFNDAVGGDMGSEHRLLFPDYYAFGPPDPSSFYFHSGKWEGLDGTIQDEDMSQVYMRDTEAEKPGYSGPPSSQTIRGVATWNVVKAAAYRLNIDMMLTSDPTQEQYFQITFDVSY